MKNYYNLLLEINTTEIRLETLKEKAEVIRARLTSCTGGGGEVGGGSHSNDKTLRYIIELSDIEEEIKLKEQELAILRRNLEKMEKTITAVKGKKDIKSRIFIMRYIEGLSAKNIASRIPCDISTVYRQINRIEKELKG